MRQTEEVRKVQAGGTEITYLLIRKRIKNMYLRVRDRQVIVTANALIPKRSVDAFVKANAGYALRLLKKQEKTEAARQRVIADGRMKAGILGKERTVRFVPAPGSPPDFSSEPVLIPVKDPADPALCEKAYEKALKQFTAEVLTEICREVYPLFEPYGVPWPEISLRHMKTRWGSCRPTKRAITLNTALIAAPREAVEYIVVHEFAHFLHADHSVRFYDAVARVMPDWKARKKLLRGIEP